MLAFQRYAIGCLVAALDISPGGAPDFSRLPEKRYPSGTTNYLNRNTRIGAMGSVYARRWSCFRRGTPMVFAEMEIQIRILSNADIPPRRWLYLGRLGGDRPPIGAATLRPEGSPVECF